MNAQLSQDRFQHSNGKWLFKMNSVIAHSLYVTLLSKVKNGPRIIMPTACDTLKGHWTVLVRWTLRLKMVSEVTDIVVWGQVVPLERSDIIQAPCDTKSCSCMEWRQTIIWTYPIPVSISPECIVNAPFMKSISYLFHVKWPLSLKTLTWHEKI